MVATLEAPPVALSRTPRPDPIPQQDHGTWQRHTPWVAALLGLGLLLLVPADSRGWMATGAAAMAFGQALMARRIRASCRALHFGAGVSALAVWHGPAAAGSFAIAIAVILVASHIAYAAASSYRPEVAPLAGRLPWRFQPAYRRLAMRFGIAGIACALGVALLAPWPVLSVTGIAIFPLFLRTYIGTLLAPRTTRALWMYAVVMHWAALGFFVPAMGAFAAAWVLVGVETMLFIGSALVIARRTGMATTRVPQLGAVGAVALLIAAVTVPQSPEWPFFASILIGVGIGAAFFPKTAA